MTAQPGSAPINYVFFDPTTLGVLGTGFSPDGSLPQNALVVQQTSLAGVGPWSTVQNGLLIVGAPPPPPPPTLAQQAVAIIEAGLTITSTSAPNVNATYACDGDSTAHIQAELLSLITRQTFADGGATVAWPDVTGTVHVFPNGTVFTAFAIAIGAFVAAGYKVANGTAAALPSPTAAIP